jgi:steroid delta-isomerase-like uncharacterized protein
MPDVRHGEPLEGNHRRAEDDLEIELLPIAIRCVRQRREQIETDSHEGHRLLVREQASGVSSGGEITVDRAGNIATHLEQPGKPSSNRPELETIDAQQGARDFVRRSAMIVCLGVTLCSTATADNVSVALGFVGAWNSHNPDAVAAAYTPNAVYADIRLKFVVTGTDQIRDTAQLFFQLVPDLKLTYADSTVKGGHGTLEYVLSGTDVGIYGTGKPFAIHGVIVFETDGTKISRSSDYYDLADLLRQVGLLAPGL